MTINKYVIIKNFSEVKLSNNGTEYRWVTLEDLQNGKTIDMAFFSDSSKSFLKKIQEGDTKRKILGEIREVNITQEMINRVTTKPEKLRIKAGDIIELFIWYLNGWETAPEFEILVKSLKLQLYRYKK